MSIFLKTDIGAHHYTPQQIIKDPVLFLAFGFGSGLAKNAPGTFGTLAAIPIYVLLMQGNSILYALAVILVLISGVWICGRAADKLGVHDYGGIVWDEIAGLLITLWGAPYSWQTVVVGFVLFRFFDIVKPWPIKWADKQVSGGLGIMLDDVLAGIFAGLLLWIILSLQIMG